MSDYKPSDFVKLGHPSCSRWGKTEIESLAEAYVKALAADGDTWKPLTAQQVRSLLSENEQGFARHFLDDHLYAGWFEMIRNQLSDSDGALGVGGFWNEFRLQRAASGERDAHS